MERTNNLFFLNFIVFSEGSPVQVVGISFTKRNVDNEQKLEIIKGFMEGEKVIDIDYTPVYVKVKYTASTKEIKYYYAPIIEGVMPQWENLFTETIVEGDNKFGTFLCGIGAMNTTLNTSLDDVYSKPKVV